MAISRNITMSAIGAGRKSTDDGGAAPAPSKTPAVASTLGGLAAAVTAATPAFTAAAPAIVAQPPAGQPINEARPVMTAPAPPLMTAAAPPFMTAAGPALTPAIRDLGVRPIIPSVFEIPPLIFQPVEKTTTQIAQGAMKQLRAAAPAVIREAINTITNKKIAAGQLLNHLERRTRVGEVLNELANDWSAETKQDFAEAFQMPNTADKLPVMDAIVSIAILNDPDLKNELLAENTSEGSQADLLENRRIVWQWPQPGTPFTPPYLIMVAVERDDTAQAQNIVQSIMGDLVDFQGYKIPSAAANKLR